MSKDDRTLIVFDVETTGTRKDHDQIIELSAQEGFGTDDAKRGVLLCERWQPAA